MPSLDKKAHPDRQWIARAKSSGIQHRLGGFPTQEAAKEAEKRFRLEHPIRVVPSRSFRMVRPGTLAVQMPHGYETLIDEDDWDLIKDFKVYLQPNGYVYFSRHVNGQTICRTLHSFLVPAPKGFHTDHRNGKTLDNRRRNLRVVSTTKNQVNRKQLNTNNKTGTRGVGYYPHLNKSKPWNVQIGINGKRLNLGYYSSKRQAVKVRKAAELEHFGELCP